MKNLKFFLLFALIIVSFSSCKTVESTDGSKEKTSIGTAVDNDILTEQASSNYQIIDENEIALSSFSFEIPNDLSLISDTVNPIVENSDGSFQLMIEDKTESVHDYKEYVDNTYSKYKAIGMDTTDVETISLNGLPTRRFALNTKDEENADVTIIFYFIEQNALKIDAVVMLKGNKLSDYSDIDNYIANFEFLES